MLIYFPTPYPDELLYSLIARYHTFSGNYYIRQTIAQLFGRNDLSSSTLIPKNLGYLAEQTGRFGLNFDSLLFKHTLLPMYALFAKQKNIDIVYKNLKNNEPGPFTNYLGLFGENGKKLNLNFCPMCRQEEIEKYGQCYWHRLHQAPGMLLCENHMIPLLKSQISTLSHSTQDYIPAASCDAIASITALPFYSHEIMIKAKKMVIDVLFCLENYYRIRKLFLQNGEAWTDVFLTLLCEHGLATEHGSIRIDTLLEAACSFWGEQWLDLLDLSWERDRRPWVISMCRRSKVPWQPVKYILMAELLCGSMEALVSRIESGDLLNKEDNIHLFKKTNDVGKIETYRARWLTARANASRDIISDIQALDPAAKIWLHRHDKEWLTENSPVSLKRGGNITRVDWNSRDCEYAKQILGAADTLYNLPGKPVQVTERKIINLLHLPPTDKLRECCPRTCLEIKLHTETSYNWKIRKIKWARLEMEEKSERLVAWAVLKKAGISDMDWNHFMEMVQKELDPYYRKKA